MSYQWLQNPFTKEVRAIDISGGTSEVFNLAQQGWISYSPTQQQVSQLPVQTIPQDTLKQGTVIQLSKNPTSEQVQAANLQLAQAGFNVPIPSTSLVSTAGGADLQQLNTFKTPEGGYNLISMVAAAQSKPELMGTIQQYFNPKDIQYAQEANKPIFDISTKEGLNKWKTMSDEQKSLFRPIHDVDIIEYNQLSDWQKLYVKDIVPTKVSPEVYSKLGEGAKKYAEPKLTTAQTASEIALSIIPIYGTMRTWEKQGTTGKALGIAADVLWIIPFVGGISAGVRLTTAGKSIGKLALAKSVVKSTKQMVIAEIKAPITAIAHPIRTGKAALEPIETMLRPSKLPLAGMEMRYNTQRIPIIGTAGDTAAVRTRIVDSMISRTGKTATGKYIKATAEMPEALWKVGPAAIHNTPDIRPFLEGATIDRSLYVSPTAHGRFIWATSSGERPVIGALTKNPYQGILLIRDKKILSQITRGQKSYAYTAELEGRLAGIKLPKPSQILMSRDLNGDPFRILIIGNKLSKAEIARFKIIGSADTLRTIFKPSIQYSKTTRASIAKLGKLEDELADLQRTGRAASNAREVGIIRSRIVKLNVRINRARIDVNRAVSGRAQYVAINTRTEPVLQDTRAIPPTQRARITVDTRAINTNISRVVPSAGSRIPPVAPPERVTPPTSDRIPPSVKDRVPPPPDLRIPPPKYPKIVPPRIPPKPPIIITMLDNASPAKRKQLLEGMVTWRQGFGWWTIYPPYGAKDRFFTKKPIKGVRIATGAGSAYKTITKLGQYVPRRIMHDLGIMDIEITKGKGMKFKRDIKRRTHLGYAEGSPTLTVTR